MRAAYGGFGLALFAIGAWVLFSRPHVDRAVRAARVDHDRLQSPHWEALQPRVPPGASLRIKVRCEPGARVLYWTAEPSLEALKEGEDDWYAAYTTFTRVGVAEARVEDGVAVLTVRPPMPYSVPWKSRVEAQVHYRECFPDGKMGRVRSVVIEEGARVDGVDASAALARPL